MLVARHRAEHPHHKLRRQNHHSYLRPQQHSSTQHINQFAVKPHQDPQPPGDQEFSNVQSEVGRPGSNKQLDIYQLTRIRSVMLPGR